MCSRPREKVVHNSFACEACPPFEILSIDQKSCVPKVCGKREKVNEDATCTPCEDYTLVSTD